jgi:hypothetical protein
LLFSHDHSEDIIDPIGGAEAPCDVIREESEAEEAEGGERGGERAGRGTGGTHKESLSFIHLGKVLTAEIIEENSSKGLQEERPNNEEKED